MIQGPCKDCKDRHTACWPTCAKYLAFREKLARAREHGEEHVADKYEREQRRKR